MAPRKKSHRAATAIVAASMIGGLHATPASAYAIDRWLDERFADPWQARTQDRGVRRYDIPEGPLTTVLAAYQSASGVTVQAHADHPIAVPLTGVYHNLLRRWAEV